MNKIIPKSISKNFKNETFHINGMNCAACRTIIERKLSKIEGIKSVKVSLINSNVEVIYDHKLTDFSHWNNIIIKFGYSINKIISHKDYVEKNKSDENRLKKQLRSLYIVGSIALFMLGHMYWEFVYLPKNPIEYDQLTNIQSLLLNAFYHFLPLMLASYCLVIHGKKYLLGIWRFFVGDQANMDSLIGLSIGAAYIYSTVLVVFSSLFSLQATEVVHFYDVVIFVILFVGIGKYLEEFGKLSTKKEINHLLKLQAKRCIIEKNEKNIEIDIEEVKKGDIVVVKPGMVHPIDGVVVYGESYVDESSFTGEAIPVLKSSGDIVIAGTLNQHGLLKIKVTSEKANTMLAKIIDIVNKALSSKASIENLVDKIAAYFVPTVLLVTVFTFIIWAIWGSMEFGTPRALSLAFLTSMSILAVACPCALGLATPMALMVGINEGTKQGILFKNAQSLEKLKSINKVFTDKTGTLTIGKLLVSEFYNFKEDLNVFDILGSLESNSTHPIAVSITKYTIEKNYKQLNVENFKETPGVGVEGKINNKYYQCLDLSKALSKGLYISNEYKNILKNKTSTAICLADEKEIIAAAFLLDQVKKEAKKSIDILKQRGIKTVMLTGDNISNAEIVAKELDIDEYYHSINPIDKMKHIKADQAKNIKVAMLGDGINDAPALALADVGVAMSFGSDAAIESAEVLLLRGDLSRLIKAFKLSDKTYKTIKRNLIWAFGFNIIAIPVAGGLLFPFFEILLNPIYASMLMAFSSFFVVINSFSLKFFRKSWISS